MYYTYITYNRCRVASVFPRQMLLLVTCFTMFILCVRARDYGVAFALIITYKQARRAVLVVVFVASYSRQQSMSFESVSGSVAFTEHVPVRRLVATSS